MSSPPAMHDTWTAPLSTVSSRRRAQWLRAAARHERLHGVRGGRGDGPRPKGAGSEKGGTSGFAGCAVPPSDLEDRGEGAACPVAAALPGGSLQSATFDSDLMPRETDSLRDAEVIVVAHGIVQGDRVANDELPIVSQTSRTDVKSGPGTIEVESIGDASAEPLLEEIWFMTMRRLRLAVLARDS